MARKQTFIFARKVGPTQIMRELSVGAQHYFPKAKHETIKALASKLGKTERRIYCTQKEQGGIVVFRDA